MAELGKVLIVVADYLDETCLYGEPRDVSNRTTAFQNYLVPASVSLAAFSTLNRTKQDFHIHKSFENPCGAINERFLIIGLMRYLGGPRMILEKTFLQD
jgi:hypothetical protein